MQQRLRSRLVVLCCSCCEADSHTNTEQRWQWHLESCRSTRRDTAVWRAFWTEKTCPQPRLRSWIQFAGKEKKEVMLIFLAVHTHSTTKNLTCGQAHTTDVHTRQLFFFLLCSFSILCLLSWARGCWCSLRSMEEKGSEQWKGISPHRGSKWQGSASTCWGPVRYTHTDRHRHTHTHIYKDRVSWRSLQCFTNNY